MKKILYILGVALIFVQINVFAQYEMKNDLKFEPAGGGKFIYCNNREEITRLDLADDGENPSYLMNNADLSPDNYRLYITHFTRIPKTVGETQYPGEDIWFDAVFTAKTDCEIVLEKTAFEIPENRIAYLNYETIRSEDSWSSMYACADLLGKPILTLRNDKVYKPREQKSTVITLVAGERVFLSEYIGNYAAVPYPKHVMMAADFELKSGKIDVNVFAAKTRTVTDGKAEYPNVHFENCGFGVYKRDRTVKGIADSLPEMTAELEYTIDDTKKDGASLPVKIYNQYFPKGNSVIAWVTNLNPQGDAYSRHLNAESSILPFKYKDPSKKTYYGSNIPENERDDVWIFDTTHSDTAEYEEGMDTPAEDYVPNYVIETDKNDAQRACNLGNYGVTLRYNLTITNSGEKDRYFDYNVTTAANVIVEVTDENGGDIAPVISKGQTNEAVEETMASVLLPAGETTKFSIGITLPVQNYGGQRQAFVINSEKAEFEFKGNEQIKPLSADHNTVKKYGIEELLKNADEEVQRIFEGNINSWEFIPFDGGYAAYNKAAEGNAYLYWYYWEITGKVFLLDNELNIKKELYLGSQPIEMTSAAGKLYVKTIANGSFVIDETLEPVVFDSYILPKDGGTGTILFAKDNRLQVSFDGDTYYNIAFQGAAPPFAEIADKGFYYAMVGKAGASADGIYWNEQPFPYEKITSEQIKELSEGQQESNIKVRVNDEILSFDTVPVIREGRILVPVRFILEKLGMKVLFDEEKGRITAISQNSFIQFTIGSNMANANGTKSEIDVPAQVINGRTFVPLRFLSEQAGFKVDWDEKNLIAVIEGKIGQSVGELEIDGDISAVPIEVLYISDSKNLKENND